MFMMIIYLRNLERPGMKDFHEGRESIGETGGQATSPSALEELFLFSGTFGSILICILNRCFQMKSGHQLLYFS